MYGCIHMIGPWLIYPSLEYLGQQWHEEQVEDIAALLTFGLLEESLSIATPIPLVMLSIHRLPP